MSVFVAVARSASLTQAAAILHQTPSALSKAIRRLEAQLHTPVFERANNQMTLNDAGRLLLPRALQLLQLAEQTRSEIVGTDARVYARIAGPTVLLWYFGMRFGAVLRQCFTDSALLQTGKNGDEALAALANGEVDFALLTHSVITNPGKNWQSHWRSEVIGSLRMQVCAGPSHPLASAATVSSAQLQQYDFAYQHAFVCNSADGINLRVPAVSVPPVLAPTNACGEDFQRRVRYRVDDLALLLALVESGVTLAYLPDYATALNPKLSRVNTAPIASEPVYLVHAPSLALGWQQQLVAAFLKEVSG